MNEFEKAFKDALLYGAGFTLDGKHIDPENLFEPLSKAIRSRVVSLDRLAVMEEATAEMARKYQMRSEWDYVVNQQSRGAKNSRLARRYLFALVGDGSPEDHPVVAGRLYRSV